MAKNNRFTVGLLVANITDPFSNSVAKGAMLAAEDNDVNLIIIPGKYVGVENQYVEDSIYEYQYNALFSHVMSENLDYLCIGIGSIAYACDKNRRLNFLKLFGNTPIITLADQFDEYDYLAYDNTSGITEAVNFLVKKSKCKNIAMMYGSLNNFECSERFNAYRCALEDNGIKFDKSLTMASDVSSDCYDEAKELLTEHPEIDGVVCANDSIANTVYKVIKELDKRIGRDICVVGFDDLPSSAKLEPPLASVRADASLLGYKAVEKAANKLKGIEDNSTTVKTSFIPRASCYENVNSLIYSDDIFKGSADDIANKVMNFIFDKPVSTASFKRGYDFIKNIVTMLSDAFADNRPNEKSVQLIIDNFNDFLNTNINLVDIIEPVLTIAECCYTWIGKKICPEDSAILKKVFDYVYKRLSMDIITTYKNIDEDRTEHIHLTNLVIRDTLMLENNMRSNYTYILRKLPYIGINTSYIYMLDKPMIYTCGTVFPTDVDWRFVSYHYGFDPHLVPKSEQRLKPKELFDNDKLPDNRRYTLVMIDLYSTEYQYGIALCEPKSSDFFGDVELVTYQLSAAVKIIALLKQQEQMLTELHTKNQALENMSMIDELTGIYNRRGFYNAANQLIKEHKDDKLVVAYADMDNLKMVNDAFGHLEGDFSLKSLANCLKSIFGKVFVAGRVGGDEYAVVAIENDCGGATEVNLKKKAYIDQLNKTCKKPYKINMSMGMYECYCQNSYDLKDAIDKADDLLYQQKQKRKKQI